MWPIVLLLAASGWMAAQQSREAAFKNASAALAAGEYEAAERGFQTILAESPADISALGNLGVIYSRTGRMADAIAVYERALRVSPEEPGILLNLGLAYFKQDDYHRARRPLEQVLRRSPANHQAIRLLAACEIHDGAAAEAIGRLERLRSEPVVDEGVWYLLAVAYGKEKQPEKAKQFLAKMLHNADPPQADFLLGRASYDSGRFEEAAEALRRVLKADDRFRGAHRELGKVLISQRDLEGGRAELQSAWKQDRQDSEALYFLGAVLAQAGRSREAIPYLELSCQRQPGSWAAFYYLGKAKLSEGSAVEAVSNLRQAVKLNPNEAVAYYALARALQMDGRPVEAKAALARVQELKAGALQAEIEAVSGGRVIGAR